MGKVLPPNKQTDFISVTMHAGNVGPDVNVKNAGMKTESKHLFPFAVKHVTWCLVAAIVISSCVGLTLYRVPLGMIKTYFWASLIICSLSTAVFVTAPLRIIIFNKLDALCMKRKPFVIQRKILPPLLLNPKHPDEKEKVLKHRQYNANLYAPTPLSKLQSRMEDIMYNIKLRSLTIDIIVHVTFMAVVAYIIVINKTQMGYYSTEIIKNLVLRGNYTNSIPFSEVNTYETFVEYLNETFLPALLLNFTDFNKPYKRRKRGWVQEYSGYEGLLPDIKKRQILNDFNNLGNKVEVEGSTAFEKGWTLSPTLKLMGKPRLRQVRVKAGTCGQLKNLQGRNLECAGDLTPFNVETDTFSLEWNPAPSKGLTLSQASPWMYRSASNTQSLPIFGKYSTYPGGGYILELAKDIKNARIILEFLDAFQWIDLRTRAVFIEFTVYCVNTNLFNVVTLIVEKPASGFLIPNYQVYTREFVSNPEEFIMWVLFSCFLFFFVLREGVRIHRTAIASYLKRSSALVNSAIILLGLVSVIFLLCRAHYVSQLLTELEKSDNNAFVSFIYAASWHNWSIYIEALLMCLSAFKLLQLLSFRVAFFKLQATLSHCYVHFLNFFAKQMVIIFAFAFLFNLTLMKYSYGFSSFDVSLSTVIWRAVALDDSFDFDIFFNSPWCLGPLFFGLFVIVVIILFANVFLVVVCLYLREIERVSLVDKYDILKYIKYLLMFRRQCDILHLKERNPFREERTDPAVMRLKGGGNKSKTLSKKKNIKRCKKKNVMIQSEENGKEEDSMKITYKDFVTKKQFDTTEYQDLPEDRTIGMKYLMLSFLSENKKMKRCARKMALKALFCSFTAAKAKSETCRSAQGRYFFVADKSTTEVYDVDRLLQMKKVVEDTAREKGWLEDEEREWKEIKDAADKLSVLNKKLCLLLRKHKLK